MAVCVCVQGDVPAEEMRRRVARREADDEDDDAAAARRQAVRMRCGPGMAGWGLAPQRHELACSDIWRSRGCVREEHAREGMAPALLRAAAEAGVGW